MPSSVFVNGSSTRRPGVYAQVDASELNGSELTTNVLALVGDFAELKSATPTQFNTESQLREFSDNEDFLNLVNVIYNPSNDSRINGQPTAVVVVNAGTSTQAYTELDDASGPAMVLKSRKWGPVGNTGVVKVAAGAGNDRTITVTINGVTEVFSYTQRDLVTLQYNGTDASATTLDVKDSAFTKLRITQTRSAISGALSLATPSWKWDGVPTFTASASGDHVLSVSGIRKDTGGTFTEVLNFTASTTPDSPLTFPVSAITALTFVGDVGATLTVSGYAFDLDLLSSPFQTIKQVTDHIAQYAAQGWNVTVVDPIIGSTPSIYLDKIAAGTNIFTANSASLRADLFFTKEMLNKSSLVEAHLYSQDGLNQIAAFTGTQPMAGGTFTGGDTNSITAAYTALRLTEVQVILHTYTDLPTQQIVRQHCEYMAGLGYGECNAWAAMPNPSTKAEIKTRTAQLNTRHICICAQDVYTSDYAGNAKWFGPVIQAAICAGMQVSTPVGTPLTWKLANVLDVSSHSSWDADQDANEMLGMGLVFFTTSRLGKRVERSITTYQTDDNPIFSEMSSNESLYTSIRDLRNNLQIQIGSASNALSAAIIRSIARTRLQFQVNTGIIKAFNQASLRVTDSGDVYVVDVAVAVSEPVNFIKINAKVTRFSLSA
jgi:hypothetical protein